MNANDLIKHLQLQSHPEGGFYKETYRANHLVHLDNDTQRNIKTAIYYMLTNDDKSHLHRIKSDELWFYHGGEALEIVYIKNGEWCTITLGSDIDKGETLQAVIPANVWFGAHLKDKTGYALVSCTVAPGFDFADFEMANRLELQHQYPHLSKHIKFFTK